MPNEKAAPQFACANEEPLIEVRCKKATTFFSPTTKKRIERDECKAHKKTPSAVY